MDAKRKTVVGVGVAGMVLAAAATIFSGRIESYGYSVSPAGTNVVELLFGGSGLVTALGLAWPKIQGLLASFGWSTKSISVAGDLLQVGRLGFAKQAFDAAETVEEKQKARDLGKAISDALFDEWFAIPAEGK